MIRIFLHGCNGRMGRVLAQYASSNPDFKVVAGIDIRETDLRHPFPVFRKLIDCDLEADVAIDFSLPEALPALLEGAVRKKTALVIGTTGYNEEETKIIKEKASFIPILQASNISLGAHLLTEVVQKIASVLGDDYDVEIIEKHHNLKKDAPSGTARALAEAVNRVFLNSKMYVFGRHSRDERRSARDIGIHAVRGGTIVGEHQVLFAGEDEVFEVKHAVYSRNVFAAGAIEAARYIYCKPAGYYTLEDMIVENSAVTNLYRSDDEALITINRLPDDPDTVSRIFQRIGRANISLDMISQTAPVSGEVNISFTLQRKDVQKTISLFQDFREDLPESWMDVKKDISKISVEGAGMEKQCGVAARIFEIMAAYRIKILTVTTSETKISYIIDRKEAERAIEAIQQTYGI